jgi:RNA polymerase sigma factor (sigma-70 family)
MISEPTDEQLIEQFLAAEQEQSQRAFARIVTRHGPSVMRICRQVLKQEQDAEDVVQATFLTLSRRAAEIRDRRMLRSWLREVAFRKALRLRAQVVRRSALAARPGKDVALGAAESHATQNELRLILHSELDRLPDKLRTLVIHCYLEERSNVEVAQILGFPVGTVKGRLWRARGILRERLLRRERLDPAELEPALA